MRNQKQKVVKETVHMNMSLTALKLVELLRKKTGANKTSIFEMSIRLMAGFESIDVAAVEAEVSSQ